MAKIRLAIRHRLKQFTDRHGHTIDVECSRIICPFFIQASRRPLFREAVMDSACELSVVPEKWWKQFQSEINWLTNRSAKAVARVAGGAYPFRYGEITVTAIQADLAISLSPISILTQFTEDNGGLSHILFGLHRGILQNRRFVVEPNLTDAWLEEGTATP